MSDPAEILEGYENVNLANSNNATLNYFSDNHSRRFS